jgi:zinc protease
MVSTTGMKKAARTIILTALLVFGSLAPAPGQGPDPAALPFAFQHYRLRNGLRVILSENRDLPLVTVAVVYGAGTLREKPGQEGLAFLLENLMFQGSENVAPFQHIGFVQKVGGELNATTTHDKSIFYETLPSNQLALALWLESDRMKTLDITRGTIERTRSGLIEEHAGRLGSDPYLASFAQFDALLYPDPLYGHPLIGSGAGLMDLAEADIRDFHRTYYVPSNAVLCIVGRIDSARTRELVARYFDTIPPGFDIPSPPRPVFTRESDAVERFAAIAAPGAGFHMGFRFFPLQAGEAYSLRLLEYVLLEGRTSRLRNRILRKDLTARYLTGALEERLSITTLKIFCLSTNAISAERSRRIVLSEIDKLRTNEISQDEITRAKRRFKTDYLERLSTNLGKALFLADAALAGKDLGSLGEELENHLRVSPAAIQAVVSKYFIPQNRVVLELGPR